MYSYLLEKFKIFYDISLYQIEIYQTFIS